LVLSSVVLVNSVHAINLDELESIEFKYLTKPTKSNWKGTDVSFGSKNENISQVVQQILKPAGKKVEGLELLDGLHRTVMMKKVKANKALKILLKCEGFKLKEQKEIFVITKDKTVNRNSCLY